MSMRRRDLSKALLVSLSAAAAPISRADGGCNERCYPATPAESVNEVPPPELAYPPGNVLRWGADPTGKRDSTSALQNAVNVAWACGNYGSPWSGEGGATPVILFPPGRYRVTGTVSVPTGVTLRGEAHPANTTSHTRIVMDSDGKSDNRNKPIFRFNRATLDGSVLMNTAVTSAIEDLEFWYVTSGGTFDRPHAEGIPFGAYPEGGSLLFDVDAADTRIVNCVFQHAPAALRIKGVARTAGKRGDGWSGNRGVGIYLENCEFDASCTHVYATDSELNLQFKGCQFFDSMHRYERCTGRVVYQSGRWHGAAWVDAATVANDLDRFTLKAADIEIGANRFVALDRARLIDISQNSVLGGTSARSWIEISDADGGSIVANAVDGSGSNAPPGQGPAGLEAAIRLYGCRNVLVAANNLTATDRGAYGGFGILSTDGRRSAYGNFISGNAVSAPYTGGAMYGQDRFVNATAGDVIGINSCADPSGDGSLARRLPVGTLVLKSEPGGRKEAREVSVFVDSADGSLKVRFPDGTVRTLASSGE